MMKRVPEKKVNEIVIGTINVRSLVDDIKLGITFDLFKTLRHTICCFQETRRTGHDIREHEGTKFIWSGKRRKRVGGVGIMIADLVQLIDIIPASDRILQVLVKINNINISVINCYAPTEDAKKRNILQSSRENNKMHSSKIQTNGYWRYECNNWK